MNEKEKQHWQLMLRHTKEEGDCLIWTAAKNYSNSAIWGRGLKLYGTMTARKCAWIIHYGREPNDRWFRPTCGRYDCIAIEHQTEEEIIKEPKDYTAVYEQKRKERDAARRARTAAEFERQRGILRSLGFPEEIIKGLYDIKEEEVQNSEVAGQSGENQ